MNWHERQTFLAEGWTNKNLITADGYGHCMLLVYLKTLTLEKGICHKSLPLYYVLASFMGVSSSELSEVESGGCFAEFCFSVYTVSTCVWPAKQYGFVLWWHREGGYAYLARWGNYRVRKMQVMLMAKRCKAKANSPIKQERRTGWHPWYNSKQGAEWKVSEKRQISNMDRVRCSQIFYGIANPGRVSSPQRVACAQEASLQN